MRQGVKEYARRVLSRPRCKLGIMCVVFTVLLLAVLGGFLALLENYEVVEKGRLLSHSGGLVYRIRFFGAYDVLVEPDHQLDKDTLNAFILVGIAFISLTFGVVLGWLRRRDRGDLVRFNILMFLGMSWLAADELLGIHETVGHNLLFLNKLPFVERPDDLIILLYGVPAVLFIARFRKTILASRPALSLMVVALAFGALAAISDIFKLPVERISELLCSSCVIIAVLLLGISHLRLTLDDMWAELKPPDPSFEVFIVGGNGDSSGATPEPQRLVVGSSA